MGEGLRAGTSDAYTNGMSRTISVRVPDELAEHLEVLAFRLTRESGVGVDMSDVARKLLTAGADANPIDETERTNAAKARAAAKSGELPGLVIPLDASRGSRPPDPPPKRGGRGPLARVLPLTARIPGGRHTESEGLSLDVGDDGAIPNLAFMGGGQ